jgi:uncharacterized protein YutD
MEQIEIQGVYYRILTDHKESWDSEAFKKRYSEILNKYDYIVGDWGYNQLRLKGFYKDDHFRATPETSISYLQEYLNEFCNYGCSYFILERLD